jgi:hypothetical protein
MPAIITRERPDSADAVALITELVFIPSERAHGLRNDSATVLRYFSAAAPAFGREALESYWPLGSEAEATAANLPHRTA